MKRNIGIFLVLAITLVIYFPSLFYHFIADDYSALLKLTTGSLQAFEYRWPAEGAYFRPLNWLPFILGRSLSGIPVPLDPGWQNNSLLMPYHILHLLFHSMNVFLVFFIANFIFKSKPYATLSAFIFAVHPVNSEVICWVSAFADIALVFFSLLSLIFFARFYLSQKKNIAFLFYAGSLLSFVLALCSKEGAISIPFLVIFTSYFLDRTEHPPIKSRRKFSWSGYFLVMFFYFSIRQYLLPFERFYGPGFLTGIPGRIFKVAYYLRDLIFPIELDLIKNFVYQHSLHSIFIAISLIFSSLFFLCLIIFKWRKSSSLIFSSIFMAITLAIPMLGIFAPARRHVYFSLAGFSIFLVSFLLLLKKRYLTICLFLLFIGLAIHTSVKRNALFQFTGQLVQKGLFELKKEFPKPNLGDIIYLVGLPGVAKNTPAFHALPELMIKFLYQERNLDVYYLSSITFTEKGIQESSFSFLDDFNLVQSLETDLERFIRVSGEVSRQQDSRWIENPYGKFQFNILERDKFGQVQKVIFRLNPEFLKAKMVYLLGFKDGKIKVLHSFIKR